MSPTPDFVIPNYNPHYDYSNKNVHGMSDSRGALIKLNKMLPDDSQGNVELTDTNYTRDYQIHNRSWYEPGSVLSQSYAEAGQQSMPSHVHHLRRKSQSSQQREVAH